MFRPLSVAIVLSGLPAAHAQVPKVPDDARGVAPVPARSEAGFQPLKGLPSKPDAAEASGVPRGVAPIVVDLKRAYQLSLAASRKPREAAGDDRAAAPDAKASLAGADGPPLQDFARFRDEWLSIGGEVDRSPFDPSGEFLDLLSRLQSLESARRNVQARGRLLSLYREYIRGSASSGISQVQVDKLSAALQDYRGVFLGRKAEYQDALDTFKLHLGLAIDAPVVPDLSALDGFAGVFADIERWADDEGRETHRMTEILARLPKGPDFVIEGVSARDVAPDDDAKLGALMAAVSRKAKDGPATLRARRALRTLVRLDQEMAIASTRLAVAVSWRSHIQDQIVAPPAAIDPAANASPQAGSTFNLLGAIEDVLAAEDRLVATWVLANAWRMEAYRALGVLPFDRWDDFLTSFSTAGSAK